MIIKFNENNWRKNKVLFITGVICSGTTDLANELAKEFDADIIHLDAYFNYPQTVGMLNKAFSKYLLECCPEYFDMLPDFKDYCASRYFHENPLGIRYWSIMDKLSMCIKGFARTNDRFVIVEGSQIFDGSIKEIKYLIEDETVYIIKEKLSVCADRRMKYTLNPTDTLEHVKRMLVTESKRLNDFIAMLYDINATVKV